MMLMKFHDFDMVFPEDGMKEVNGEKRKHFNSVMIRYLRNGKTKEYLYYNHYHSIPIIVLLMMKDIPSRDQESLSLVSPKLRTR